MVDAEQPDALTCAVCGAAGWGPGLRKDPYEYAACRGCGVLRLDPLPSPDVAAALYDRVLVMSRRPGRISR